MEVIRAVKFIPGKSYCVARHAGASIGNHDWITLRKINPIRLYPDSLAEYILEYMVNRHSLDYDREAFTITTLVIL